MTSSQFSVICGNCEKEVNDYSQIVRFNLTDQGAQQSTETVFLSCGCIVDFPSFDINLENGMCTITDFLGRAYITFYDADLVLEGMKILKGGSAEVAPSRWKKFDVELDESDLQAIVVKNKLDYAQLTVGMKYMILVKQAEILITVDFESDGLQSEKSSRDLIQEFTGFLRSLPVLEG